MALERNCVLNGPIKGSILNVLVWWLLKCRDWPSESIMALTDLKRAVALGRYMLKGLIKGSSIDVLLKWFENGSVRN